MATLSVKLTAHFTQSFKGIPASTIIGAASRYLMEYYLVVLILQNFMSFNVIVKLEKQQPLRLCWIFTY